MAPEKEGKTITDSTHDIHPHGTRPETVRLRGREVPVQIGTWRVRVGWRQARRFFARHTRSASVLAACILLVLVGVALIHRGRADTTTFYPASCLGGWKDPSLAAGMPAAQPGQSDAINESNAAALVNTQADLFCGSFTGNVPTSTTLTKLTLVPSWRFTDTPLPAAAPIEVVPQSGPPQPASTSSPTDTTAASSSLLLPTFVTPAYAQETTTTTSITTQATDTNDVTVPEATTPETTTTNTAPAAATSTDIQATTTGTTTGATTTAAATTDPPVLELRYSLDGQTWNTLGMVSRTTWQDAQFVVPLANPTWEDIAKLQISASPIATVDTAPAIYIDGFTLQAEYGKTGPADEASSTAPEAIDPHLLHFVDITVSNLHVTPLVATDSEGEKLTVTGLPSGSLAIYAAGGGSVVYATGVGAEKIELPAYFLKPGAYTAASTQEPNGCTEYDLAECEKDPATLGTFSFTVTLNVPPPASSSTTSVIIYSATSSSPSGTSSPLAPTSTETVSSSSVATSTP